MTLCGKKPVSYVISFRKPEEECLKKIGLAYRIKNNNSSYITYISKEEELLDNPFDYGNYEKLGKLFGYPKSAIETFCREMEEKGGYSAKRYEKKLEKIFGSLENIPKELGFISFIPSDLSENGELPKEEQKTAEEYEKTVREYAPEIYEEVLDKLDLKYLP